MDASAPLALAREAGRLQSDGPQATRDLGRAIGAAAGPGTFVALRGPLGAGKTQLAKGIAEGLGVTSVVNSPTFILMNEHAGRLRLFHVDAYRLDEPDEALAAGLLDERQAEGLTVVEWAERIGPLLPDERLEIEIALPADGGETRTLDWRASGTAHVALAAAMAASDGADR